MPSFKTSRTTRKHSGRRHITPRPSFDTIRALDQENKEAVIDAIQSFAETDFMDFDLWMDGQEDFDNLDSTCNEINETLIFAGSQVRIPFIRQKWKHTKRDHDCSIIAIHRLYSHLVSKHEAQDFYDSWMKHKAIKEWLVIWKRCGVIEDFDDSVTIEAIKKEHPGLIPKDFADTLPDQGHTQAVDAAEIFYYCAGKRAPTDFERGASLTEATKRRAHMKMLRPEDFPQEK